MERRSSSDEISWDLLRHCRSDSPEVNDCFDCYVQGLPRTKWAPLTPSPGRFLRQHWGARDVCSTCVQTRQSALLLSGGKRSQKDGTVIEPWTDSQSFFFLGNACVVKKKHVSSLSVYQILQSHRCNRNRKQRSLRMWFLWIPRSFLLPPGSACAFSIPKLSPHSGFQLIIDQRTGAPGARVRLGSVHDAQD